MARGTERMKEVIRGYLEREAAKDAAFAQSYAREDKSLDECIDYIITTERHDEICSLVNGAMDSIRQMAAA